MKKTKKTDDEIAGLVYAALNDMEVYDDRDLNAGREKALRYYEGEMREIDPDDPDGSKAVSYDVRDAVDWIMPQIMRIFFGGQQVFDYKPTSRQYAEECGAAKEFINNELLYDAYEKFFDVMHDALLQQNGIVKAFWDSTPQYETRQAYGLGQEDIDAIEANEKLEITNKEKTVLEMPDDSGEAFDVDVFDVTIREEVAPGIIVTEGIPREEFLITINARSIKESRGVSHRKRETRGDLLERGYSRKQVEKLQPYTAGWRQEEYIRDNYYEAQDHHTEDWAMQEVAVYETYMLIDHDNDGIASELKIISSGEQNTMLEWEVWDDDRPFYDISPERRAHRFAGRSVADHIMDIQEIKTVILRQTLDNVYDSNDATIVVQKHLVHNLDTVYKKERGRVIMTKGPGAYEEVTPNFTAAESYKMLTYMDEMMQKRIGASENSMALDMDSLQRQTEFATQQAVSQAYTKVEYIARNMAEGGLRRVGMALYSLARKYHPKGEYRIKDNWVTVDPERWPERVRCTVNVGLGTGSRERDLSMLQMLLALQKEAIAATGPTAPVSAKLVVQIRETMVKIAQATNLQNAEDFFPELGEEDLKAMQKAAMDQPNPLAEAEAVKAKATMESAQLKVQAEAEKGKQEAQFDIQKLQVTADFDREKLQSEREEWQSLHAIKMAELELAKEELRVEAEKIGMDAGFKQLDIDFKEAEAEMTKDGDGRPQSAAVNVLAQIADRFAEISQRLAETDARAAMPKKVYRDENSLMTGWGPADETIN